MIPALTPNPRKNSTKSPCRRGPDTTCPASTVDNDKEPEIDESVKNPAARAPVPTWDMTRYKYAARRVSRTSCSVATSAAVARVISSHANRNPITLLTTNTTSTVASSTLNPAPTAAVRERGTACARYPTLYTATGTETRPSTRRNHAES